MKLTKISAVILTLFIAACQPTTDTAEEKDNGTKPSEDSVKSMVKNMDIDPENEQLKQVTEEVRQAIEAKDYRLYATTGRRVVLPGIVPEQMEQVKQQCGYKKVDDYKDNYSSVDEREKLAAKRDYAKQYNQIMLAHCQKQPQ